MINKSVVLAEREGIFYEGDDTQLWTINPPPAISRAKFQPPIVPAPNAGVLFDALFFREDYFDATTRIRRGRFYGTDGGGSFREWQQNKVSTWPRGPLPLALQGMVQMHAVYRRIKIEVQRNFLLKDATITLGGPGYESDWRAVDVEQTANDELLFTLKPIFPFGILPTLTIDDRDVKEPLKKSFTMRFRYDSLALTERIALDAAQFRRV